MPLLGNNSGILSLGILTTRLRKSGIRWLPLKSAEVVAQNDRIHQKFFQNQCTHNEPEHLIMILQLATLPPGTGKGVETLGINQVKSAEGFFSNDSKIVKCLPVFFRFLFHAFFSCPCAVLNPRLLVEKSFS